MSQTNPIGIKSIDHLEFTCDSPSGKTAKLFETMGFAPIQKSTNQTLYKQGQIRFLVSSDSSDSETHTRKYFEKHGEGVSKISFWVENAEKALETAVKRGAVEKQNIQVQETEQGLIKTACIQGFGDVLNEFVERPSNIFRPGFDDNQYDDQLALKTRCSRIDHLTNNVPHGQMEHWVEFYERVYGFVQTRYFDIKGSKTSLKSKVVQSPDNNIIIPINQPETPHGKCQIQEFLDLHQGPGVQHIALMTPDIISTVGELQDRKIEFLDVPSTYYEDVPNRPFKIEENLETLERLNLLVDGDPEGYLLQIFSQTCIGPLFFEYIQRKNHWGFGEGNFQALFDAIERDQIKRGYL